MQDDDLTIPDFCKIPDEVRKAAWERNPPTQPHAASWRSPEQEALHKARQQQINDERRLARCVSKQKRLVREQRLEAKLESNKARAEGKQWDVRTARWIDPIEPALQKEKAMVQVATGAEATRKKKTVKTNATNVFGFRANTNYHRLTQYLLQHIGRWIPIKSLAEEAYQTTSNLEKHERRVVTMARKVQEKVITKKRMDYVIKKEKNDDGICIGLFEK